MDIKDKIEKEAFKYEDSMKNAFTFASRDAAGFCAGAIKFYQLGRSEVIEEIRELMKSMPARSDLSVYQHTMQKLDTLACNQGNGNLLSKEVKE